MCQQFLHAFCGKPPGARMIVKFPHDDPDGGRELVISAYRAGQITGSQAWDTLTKNSLWPDKEEAFFLYFIGLEAFETQKELWSAPGRFKQAARSLIAAAHAGSVLSAASAEWLRDLFGYPKGDLPCGK
jgi:hypothetical protein